MPMRAARCAAATKALLMPSIASRSSATGVGHPGASAIADGATVVHAPSPAQADRALPRPVGRRLAARVADLEPTRIGEIVRTKSTTRFIAVSFSSE
jgi:hypothetical protein